MYSLLAFFWDKPETSLRQAWDEPETSLRQACIINLSIINILVHFNIISDNYCIVMYMPIACVVYMYLFFNKIMFQILTILIYIDGNHITHVIIILNICYIKLSKCYWLPVHKHSGGASQFRTLWNKEFQKYL